MRRTKCIVVPVAANVRLGAKGVARPGSLTDIYSC
jgi:hypothetical protein